MGKMNAAAYQLEKANQMLLKARWEMREKGGQSLLVTHLTKCVFFKTNKQTKT